MGVLTALLGAALFGASNGLAGQAARRSSPLAVLPWSTGAALLVSLLAVPVLGAGGWAASAPVGLLASVVAFGATVVAYRALARGPVGVAATAITVASTVTLVAADAVRGVLPDIVTTLGLLLAVAGVVLVSRPSTAPGADVSGSATTVAIGAVAGAGFAGFVLVLSTADPGTGIASLVCARAGLLVLALLAVAVARLRRDRQRTPAGVAALGTAAGTAEVAGNVAVLAALAAVGPTVVGAASATGPAWSATLASLVWRETLTRLQILGIGVSVVGAVVAAL